MKVYNLNGEVEVTFALTVQTKVKKESIIF